MSTPAAPSKFTFLKADCQVSLPTRADGSPLLIGVPTANVNAGGKFMTLEETNSVLVTHIPTGISVVEDKFSQARNLQLAYIKLEALVNKWIAENG